ncbi:MAG: SH3 domain-containing protein [Bacilli bacterium]|nr:SH3 domain-containing protein [Bacilli bacterium]
MKKIQFTILLFFLSIYFIACGQNKTIKFEDDSLSVKVNEYVEIPLVLENLTNADLGYSFSVPNMAEFKDGKFYFLSPGTLKITAFYINDKNICDTITIIVEDLKREISIKNTAITMHPNDKTKISLMLTNLVVDDLEFAIEDPNIIDISTDLEITAKNIGSSSVRIYYSNDLDIFADITVTVEAKKTLEFSVESIILNDNETAILPIITSGLTLEDEINFSFSESGIIEIQDNKIIPLKAGEVLVTASLLSNSEITANLGVVVNNAKPVYTINDYEYWVENLDSKFDPYSIILNKQQIEEYNNKVLSNYTNTKVLDILKQPKTISKNSLESLINNYSIINKYSVYNNTTKLIATNQEKNNILANRNLGNIPAIVDVKYGIVTNFSSLRSYPTNFYSQTNTLDRFQETALNVGEGVLVYHTSLDNNWYFVQAQNYNGWVESKNIAICSYEQMDEFLNSDNFIVVTADVLYINSVWVRMGQRIPYTNKSEDYYLISFPTRDDSGNLELKEISLAADLDISDGYLEYTLVNVFNQGFKMLGIEYSWGDKYIEGRDCSSTQNAIYATFGFKMPRNTSNQSKIPDYSSSGKYTINQIKENYQPGTLLFASGHVLMYIGEDINGVSYVLHNTNAAVAGCKVQKLSEYGIHNIIGVTKFYNN